MKTKRPRTRAAQHMRDNVNPFLGALLLSSSYAHPVVAQTSLDSLIAATIESHYLSDPDPEFGFVSNLNQFANWKPTYRYRLRSDTGAYYCRPMSWAVDNSVRCLGVWNDSVMAEPWQLPWSEKYAPDAARLAQDILQRLVTPSFPGQALIPNSIAAEPGLTCVSFYVDPLPSLPRTVQGAYEVVGAYSAEGFAAGFACEDAQGIATSFFDHFRKRSYLTLWDTLTVDGSPFVLIQLSTDAGESWGLSVFSYGSRGEPVHSQGVTLEYVRRPY